MEAQATMSFKKLVVSNVVAPGDILRMHVDRDPSTVPQPMIRAHSVLHNLRVTVKATVICEDKEYARPSLAFTALFPRLSRKLSWLDCTFAKQKTLRILLRSQVNIYLTLYITVAIMLNFFVCKV